MNELRARFYLNASAVFAPDKQHQIIEEFGSAQEFFTDEKKAAEFAGQKEYQRFLDKTNDLIYSDLFDKLCEQGIRFVLKEDEEYPKSLHYVDSPPHLLYVRGQIPPSSLFGISIIGARRPSMYGRKQAELFAARLAERRLCIISGLARGIDALAMDAALSAGAQVIGVLGCGIDVVYPAENKKLYEKIANQGALVSEFPPGAKPLKHHFPWRNRLISAWALGLLVIEATIRSGTLVTVRWALNQGKDIFALPGPVTNETSRGCHLMIREGAHLVESPNDIFEFYEDVMAGFKEESSEKPDTLLENELGLVFEPLSVDELMLKSGLEYVELTRKLNEAVAEGWAKRCPGACYALI
ncbi:MAG: DNA-protecting protein DprA [Planctomycetes bacterium]|nr:DNA-protecting protein DprA [Planctomycetota bacterium]